MTTHTNGTRIGILAATLALLPAGLLAQTTTPDARWLPFVGCWTAADADADAVRCVLPTEDAAAVEMRTYDDGALTGRTVLHTDGRERSVEIEGCTGREQASFSADGHRVYVRSSLVCAGEVERESTRLLAMVGSTAWVDIEAVRVLGQSAATVERYVPAAGDRVAELGLADPLAGRAMAAEAARFAAAADYTVDDLIEATRQVDPEAVRAWVAERGDPLELDAQRLIAMADAGVPETIIDVAIAVSYPDRFAVGRKPEPDAVRGRRIPVGGLYGWAGWRDRYGFYSPYYYGFSPYGWGYWGYGSYGSYWGGIPSRVVVVPRIDTDPPARVVKGRGYTRGGSATGAPAAHAPGMAPSRGRATASSRGWSSSGASKGTTRKAKPRGGSGPGG